MWSREGDGEKDKGRNELYIREAWMQILSVMHNDDNVSLGWYTIKHQNSSWHIAGVYSGVGWGGGGCEVGAGWGPCKGNGSDGMK